jgi:restriction endonuclease S subunit
MFGDPVSNPKGWEMKKIGEVTNIRRGASPRPMGDPLYFGGTIPWIRISDIHKNGKFLNDTEDHVTEEGAKRSVYLKAGSLIMAMAASIGTPCFLAVAGCIHDGFVVFEKLSPKLDKEFLYYFIIAFKDRFVSLAPEGTQKNLNTALIKAVTLPLPPLSLQQEFAKLVEDIEAEKARQAESRKKLDELFQSLMQRAFTGELVA